MKRCPAAVVTSGDVCARGVDDAQAMNLELILWERLGRRKTQSSGRLSFLSRRGQSHKLGLLSEVSTCHSQHKFSRRHITRT
jgi:hypothetical protein